PIYCGGCHQKYEFLSAFILPSNGDAKFVDPGLTHQNNLYTPIHREINLYYSLLSDAFLVLIDNKGGDFADFIRNIKFRYGVANSQLEAFASKDGDVYVSHLLFLGIKEFFLTIMARDDFIFKSANFPIERIRPIKITPNRTLSDLMGLYSTPETINLFSNFESIEADEVNLFIIGYFNFLAFSFLYFHEISHLLSGHINIADRLGINKLFINPQKIPEKLIFHALEMDADIFATQMMQFTARRQFNLFLDSFRQHSRLSDFVNEYKDTLSLFALLAEAYVAIVVPFFFSKAFPVSNFQGSHPPGLIRSLYCRNACLDSPLVTGNQVIMLHFQNIWNNWERALVANNYFGEVNIFETEEMKSSAREYIDTLSEILNLLGIKRSIFPENL
ncbi:MAG: hypothetical protein HQL57_07735, partial [Magnetococcales bacterium]|nr:hypothetical protein [Magnetococcales bacterium]